MEPTKRADHTPLKGGNMILNRFCIDEDAAFELSGVNYLKKWSVEMECSKDSIKSIVKREAKGKEDSFLRSYFISSNLIFLNN